MSAALTQMQMTSSPETSFLVRLKAESYTFADTATLTVWGLGAAYTAWSVGHFLGQTGPIPQSISNTMAIVIGGWFAFKCAACLIDYTIYAASRALVELIAAGLSAYVEQPQTEVPEAQTPADSTVVYLRDAIARSKAVAGFDAVNRPVEG
jgi:hypothetical protein